MRIRLAGVDLGADELDAVAAVFASGVLTNGPATASFEQAFASRHGAEHGVAFANGTVALQAMYLALGIGPGDEVIVPSLTFISSATSILHVGATPVFADVDAETFNLDPADVARRVTPRTKAILAVHYGGQPADMAELQAIADDAGAVLLEDAAEAHGATYRGSPVGAIGRAGMFSFTPTKNITTGEGGVVTTNDGDLAAAMRLLRNHGQTSLYEHAALGFNWRITEMQAAIGTVQVGKLDGIVSRKQSRAVAFGERVGSIDGVRAPVVRDDRTSVFMLYTLLLDAGLDRDAVRDRMLAAGVEARVYFPPAHRQPVFAPEGSTPVDLPVTDDVASRILSVPFHARLSDDDLAEVADQLEKAVACTS